mmetsp:Transcript_72011/g.142774  ORF Transcript_72011/g.142774 Transcript_72011/m.142774 type:complete len:365 (+) Transcript_72011:713-1807(+)
MGTYARRDVRSDEDGRLARTEVTQRRLALTLVLVAVDGRAANLALHSACEAVARALGRAKDEDSGSVRHGVDLRDESGIAVLGGREHDHHLPYVGVGRQRVVRIAHAHLDWLAEELGGQLAHSGGPRGGEHERLALPRQLGNDLADLRLEPHVEHAVSLIHDEVVHTREDDLTKLNEVVKPPWCGNYHLWVTPQFAELRAAGSSAIHHDRADAARAAELDALIADLDGKLARRGKYQDSRTSTTLRWRLPRDQPEGGREEGQSLAGACLRHADDVAARKGSRPGSTLDERRRGEAGRRYFTQHEGRKGSVVEAEHRRRTASTQLDVVLREPGSCLAAVLRGRWTLGWRTWRRQRWRWRQCWRWS